MNPGLNPSEIPIQVLEQVRQFQSRNKLSLYFPDIGPRRRELYPKHMEFFAAGAQHKERAFIAGNRVGKTDAGSYETTLHLTGDYPAWWIGKRFEHATKAWAAGDTNKTVREILQEKMLGKPGQYGTGMIPADSLVRVTTKQGIAEAVDTVYVKHKSGNVSVLKFKSYQEGRLSFQGDGIHFGWMDEECPEEIYDETLTRTMTTNGSVILTFTPLEGLTPTVLRFLPGGQMPKAA